MTILIDNVKTLEELLPKDSKNPTVEDKQVFTKKYISHLVAMNNTRELHSEDDTIVDHIKEYQDLLHYANTCYKHGLVSATKNALDNAMRVANMIYKLKNSNN